MLNRNETNLKNINDKIQMFFLVEFGVILFTIANYLFTLYFHFNKLEILMNLIVLFFY